MARLDLIEVLSKFSSSALNTGCNYCFWALNFRTGSLRGVGDRLALTREVGRVQMELTCMYTVHSRCV